jgi:hypothetical protein
MDIPTRLFFDKSMCDVVRSACIKTTLTPNDAYRILLSSNDLERDGKILIILAGVGLDWFVIRDIIKLINEK